MHILLAAAFALAANTAQAGVPEALDEVLLPGFAGFAKAADDLSEAAGQDCTPTALTAPYNATWSAWLNVGVFLLGPTEATAPHIAFWPDKKGFTPRTLQSLIAAQSPVIDQPEAFAEVSVAGKGLFALEQLLFAPAFNDYRAGSYTCRLVQTVTSDLARTAADLDTAWRTAFAHTLTTAGAPDNAVFFDAEEATRALYTQILHALEFTALTRIGRPMGTFDKPRPRRAEARLSGRGLANVIAATEAAVALADALADWPLPQTHAALEAVHEAAAKIDDPSLADVEDFSARFKLEVLQQKVQGVEAAIEQEIGLVLGVAPGFNASDGD